MKVCLFRAVMRIITNNYFVQNYIAREGQSYDTSAKYVRETMLKCIRKVREANGADNEHMHEAYRDLGSALHTLEDLLAHSNWCELALRKMGHSQVFCHVGDKGKLSFSIWICWAYLQGSQLRSSPPLVKRFPRW